MNVKISVCIPSFNRVDVLEDLLKSVLNQDYHSFEMVICEDKSPQRPEIRSVVHRYMAEHPGIIRYFENETNYGYDGNLRNVIEQAAGDYCLFMGNDDLMCPGALRAVDSALNKHANIGVVLRSYASFDASPENIRQVFRYFPEERFFPAGAATVTTFYRRSVVIPGMVIHRQAALKFSTDRFDGTLLYQLYLVANILLEKNGVFLPEILVLYRNGGIPDFGNSEKERGRFVPADQTPESSLLFMRGMLEIAAWVENERKVNIYKGIRRDIGNYSYPILAIQARRSSPIFLSYAAGVAKMGFWRFWRFHLYAFALLCLGPTRVERLIVLIKERYGYTPAIGSIYDGEVK